MVSSTSGSRLESLVHIQEVVGVVVVVVGHGVAVVRDVRWGSIRNVPVAGIRASLAV